MIRVPEIKTFLDEDVEIIRERIIETLKVKDSELLSYKIYKESIDARKAEIKIVYTVDCQFTDEQSVIKNNPKAKITMTPDMEYKLEKIESVKNEDRPVIIGFGPSGIFAGLIFAEAGYKPIIFERGKEVDLREEDVKKLWQENILNEESNIQFGEGGAGTFSDGKLTTRIKDIRCRKVLEELVEAGASNEIMYKQKPHIGTDVLRGVVKNIREKIISLGGEVHFQEKLTNIVIENDTVKEIEINNSKIVPVKKLVIASGHSARDMYELLNNKKINIEQKPFSIGVRIEHPQELINKSQYGKHADNEKLGAADYKLVHHCSNDRGVYSFCMCPGGKVVCGASEEGGITTNGMSFHSRNGMNANSALLVSVTPSDFESDNPLAGIEYQRKWERLAFELAGSDYSAPAQKVGDFLRNKTSEKEGTVETTYKPDVKWSDITKCLPGFVTEALREAIPKMSNKIRGFDMNDAVLVAPETRSSSPVRVVRDDNYESSIKGIYPIGEGAGYAGGIVSAAVDGVVCAEKIMELK